VGWFHIFFFFSGVTALIYETAFARQLHLIFGSTLSAASVVLAVFFGGLALGAAILGPWADRYSPLRLYALLEIGAGICALLAVVLFPFIRNLYGQLSSYLNPSVGIRILIQSIMASLILLPSTILMGATLPALSRGLTTSLHQRFKRISWLYGINTMGATFGTMLCGFLLLEHLGYVKTVMAAMAANFIIGLSAMLLATRFKQKTVRESTGHETKPTEEKQTESAQNRVKTGNLRKLILVVAGISGVAALGYEVVWFRILIFSVVADTYAFSLMLAIYLLGISIGSLVAARRLRYRKETTSISSISWFELGILEIGVSILVVLGFAILIWLNTEFSRPQMTDPTFWWRTISNTSLQAMILIMPVTLLLGYIFPLLVSLYAASMQKMGTHVGRVSAVNTFGAIIGSLCSAFILIPLIGIQQSLIFLAGLSSMIGIVVLIIGPIRKRLRLTALGIAIPVCLSCLLLFPIHPNFGFLQIPTYKNAELLFYEESADQTVMVTDDLGDRQVRRLIIDQQQATSTDIAGQRKNQLMGHLPLWACPKAEKALVICFGSGGTFGALGLYDLGQVDCVEICAAVITAAPLFAEWNGNVLNREHVRVIIDDGRSYLLTNREQYDIITLEPMHPGLKGVSALYSLEFYEEARKRLRPGGVLCQWVPLYSMTGEDARSLIATVAEVFPQSSLWIVGSEGIIVSAQDSLLIGWHWLNEQMLDAQIQSTLHKVYLDNPWTVLSGFLLGPEGLAEFAKGAPIIRDDHPFIEYTIPRHKHIFPWNEILSLAKNRESPISLIKDITPFEQDSLERKWRMKKSSWVERDHGFAALSQGDFPAARRHLEVACSNNPEDRYAKYFLKEIYWRYGVEFTHQGRYSEALEAYKRATRLDPGDHKAHFYLAVAFYNAGRTEESMKEAKISLGLKPDFKLAKSFLDRIKEIH